jgi:flagellar hook-associated protein 1 FlgK
VSGVNLDEEAADLIKYQQAYQAASQISVVSNTIFDSLISAI